MTQGSRPVGILGGMGPEATILLQEKVMQAVPAQDDSDHIPLIVDMNTAVPSRIAHLIEGTGEDPAPTLAAMARQLQAAGAVALAMPCNTAHHYADAIAQAVDIPLLNMIDLAATHAAQAVGQGGRVGVLASPAVRKTQLFEKALTAYGVTALWPQSDDAILAAIKLIKAEGPVPAARTALRNASGELRAAGAQMQLIACSEFSIIADSVADGVAAVDAVDLLAAAIIEAASD